MIPNVQNEGWQYLQVQKITASLRRITSKHDGDFYCLNFVLFFWTENKLKSHEKVCKNKGFGGIIILSQKDNILHNLINIWSQIKCHPFFYADLESLTEN